MRIAGTRRGRGAQFVLATGIWLAALPAVANAQIFNGFPGLRPPNDVPSVPPGPSQNILPPSGNAPPPAPAAAKGPMLQSLPAAGHPGVQPNKAAPAVPAGPGAVAVGRPSG